MKFEHTTTYAADPETVYAMLLDRAFREQVAQSQGSPTFEIDISTDGPTTTVSLLQAQLVRKVPDFAKKVVGEQVTIKQVEHWTSALGGDFELTIPGKPGSLYGTVALTTGPDGTTHTVAGELKVAIPFLGGRLEPIVAELITLARDAEAEVGASWLAERS